MYLLLDYFEETIISRSTFTSHSSSPRTRIVDSSSNNKKLNEFLTLNQTSGINSKGWRFYDIINRCMHSSIVLFSPDYKFFGDSIFGQKCLPLQYFASKYFYGFSYFFSVFCFFPLLTAAWNTYRVSYI